MRSSNRPDDRARRPLREPRDADTDLARAGHLALRLSHLSDVHDEPHLRPEAIYPNIAPALAGPHDTAPLKVGKPSIRSALAQPTVDLEDPRIGKDETHESPLGGEPACDREAAISRFPREARTHRDGRIREVGAREPHGCQHKIVDQHDEFAVLVEEPIVAVAVESLDGERAARGSYNVTASGPPIHAEAAGLLRRGVG